MNRNGQVIHNVIRWTEKIVLHQNVPYDLNLVYAKAIYVDFALQFSDYAEPLCLSYANLRETPEGGVHVEQLKNAVKDTVVRCAQEKHLLGVDETLNSQLLDALTVVINVQLERPRYSRKSALSNEVVNPDLTLVYPVVARAVENYFNSHPDELERLLAHNPDRISDWRTRRYGEYAGQMQHERIH